MTSMNDSGRRIQVKTAYCDKIPHRDIVGKIGEFATCSAQATFQIFTSINHKFLSRVTNSQGFDWIKYSVRGNGKLISRRTDR